MVVLRRGSKAKEERREQESRRLLNTRSDHVPCQGLGVGTRAVTSSPPSRKLALKLWERKKNILGRSGASRGYRVPQPRHWYALECHCTAAVFVPQAGALPLYPLFSSEWPPLASPPQKAPPPPGSPLAGLGASVCTRSQDEIDSHQSNLI